MMSDSDSDDIIESSFNNKSKVIIVSSSDENFEDSSSYAKNYSATSNNRSKNSFKDDSQSELVSEVLKKNLIKDEINTDGLTFSQKLIYNNSQVGNDSFSTSVKDLSRKSNSDSSISGASGQYGIKEEIEENLSQKLIYDTSQVENDAFSTSGKDLSHKSNSDSSISGASVQCNLINSWSKKNIYRESISDSSEKNYNSNDVNGRIVSPILISDGSEENNNDYDKNGVEILSQELVRISNFEVNSKNDSIVHSLQNLCSDHDTDNNLQSNEENLIAEIMRLEYEINDVTTCIETKKEALKTMFLDNLPDKGMKLKIALQREQRSLDSLNEQLSRAKNKLKGLKMNDSNEILITNPPKYNQLPSANLEQMGQKALETHRVQQALTVESLRNLHHSLNACPSEDEIVPDPAGLKVPLMMHQKQALSWLMWREKEKPSGGILADDMGLGKTLTMISLILKRQEETEGGESSGSSCEDEGDDDKEERFSARKRKVKGGTLIICPSSLVGQWESEIRKRVRRDLLSYEIHHGSKREKKPRRLARFDVIITSYSIVRVEFQNSYDEVGKSTSPLFNINWKRIILDEAHVIRNHVSKTSEAVFHLKGIHRWILTGTPIHNKTKDFFALIKFLRCKPFNDFDVWKKWVEAKDETGAKRLNMLTKTLMLRRTKEILMSSGKLPSLPEKSSEQILVHLSKNELALYEEVANFSKTLLAQLLYQRAEKEQLLTNGIQINRNKQKVFDDQDTFSQHPALSKLYQRVISKDNVKTHEILVLLLRLRQICCHPALMKSMIEKEAVVQDGIEDEDGSDMDLLEKMSAMTVTEDTEENKENQPLDSSCENVFNPNHYIFKTDWPSSKIQAILKLIEENLLKTEDKIVIVSQWSSMLELIYEYLKKFKTFKCDLLTGKVPVSQRMDIVNEFNKHSSNLKILLLSLTAGGTGLNLIGGNHLILTDPHWNPQLESQACDRIYRMGQNKPVKIYKFICTETIEEKIQMLQNDKLALAEGVLSGAKQIQVAKLSLNDLKMLFNVS